MLVENSKTCWWMRIMKGWWTEKKRIRKKRKLRMRERKKNMNTNKKSYHLNNVPSI